jgi:DnaJ like chaperone protein
MPIFAGRPREKAIFAVKINSMKYLFVFLLIALVIYFLFYRKKTSGPQTTEKQGSDSSNKSYAKWIGGTLGWAFGGPIGALLGFAFGKMYEDMDKGTYAMKGTAQGDFNLSLLVLTAAVMKADGTVKQSELEYVKRFFIQNFGAEAAERYILMLREILKQEIKLPEVCQQIGRYMDYAARLQLMHYLFGVARADNQVADSELHLLNTIGAYLGLNPADFNSIKAMFVKEINSAYKILELEPDATNDEIKKAYREMAFKYHPDKVSHLGEDVHKAAEEKFQKVTAAYDQIKKKRGIK